MRPIAAKPGLTEQVYEKLLNAISDGSLKPGQRLAQEALAERLRVSRQPVSHALALLEQQKLVVRHGKRGLAVAPWDRQRVRDLYQVRAALDGLAARLAAAQVRAGGHRREVLERLRQALAAGQMAIRRARVADRIKADVAFHAALYQLSGNAAIVEVAAGMWPHFRRSMGVVLQDSAIRARVWDEHVDILAAIEAGQPDAAERYARKHAERIGAEVWDCLTHDDGAAEGGTSKRATAAEANHDQVTNELSL